MSTVSLPYGKQSIDSTDLQSTAKILSSEWITRGPETVNFEKYIAQKVGATYAVTFNSGSSALAASYYAGDLSTYDKVITSSNTFIATISPALRKGCPLYFPDIDPNTGAVDINRLEAVYYNISKNSQGKTFIVPVHFAGNPFPMERLSKSILPNTVIIEDAAHAFGSCYSDGSSVGNCRYSDMTIFSFHPLKSITTGEGGCVTTNNAQMYEKLLLYRNNGIVPSQDPNRPWEYDVVEATGNYHMTSFQAGLGMSQMEKLEEFKLKRLKLVDQYKHLFAETEHIKLLTFNSSKDIFFHLMVAQINFKDLKISKEALIQFLNNKGIGTQVHYVPLYNYSIVKPNIAYVEQKKMEAFYSKVLSFPLYADMTESDVDYVYQSVMQALQ